MIRTEALTKYYGRRCAVRDLSVTIEDQEIVGFLGLNGAGKTTTLRMLAGLLAPSSGRIEIDGQDILDRGGHDLRWRIGFLPERPPLYDEMTVRRYLAFAARLRGYDRAALPKRIEEVLAFTDLESVADDPIASLSHGFRQRCGIAQAIVHEPTLVILDEPITGLDPKQIVEMRKLIRSLRDRHTVLLSSHNLPEISQTCDQILVIRDGALVHVGNEASMEAGEFAIVALALRGDKAVALRVLEDGKKTGLVHSFRDQSHGEDLEFSIQLARNAPEELAQAVVSAGLGLRRLQPEVSELESMFLELTRRAA